MNSSPTKWSQNLTKNPIIFLFMLLSICVLTNEMRQKYNFVVYDPEGTGKA
jgi:hypothetical protein